MNQLLQTCKHHWVGGENTHWGHTAKRRAFSPEGTEPRFAPDTPLMGRHMRTELHLEPEAERVWGVTTHTLEVLAAQPAELRLNAVGLEISAVRVGVGKAAPKAAPHHHDGEVLAVELPKSATRGATLTVQVEHAVTAPGAGLYFTNPDGAYPGRFQTVWSQGQDEDSRYYLPCLDAPRFKQTVEAVLHVPKGWFALSNGALVGHKKGGPKAGEDTWHYRLDIPCATYLFTVVAGNFTEHREKAGKTEVLWYCQPGRETEAKNAFAKTAAMLRFLQDFTGVPYPHARYTQIAVPDFIFGGMENFTATTQTDLTLHDDRAHRDFSSDDLVLHEAAHTWFGNMVTARGWDHAWLHESFATYFESLWMEHDKGVDEAQYQLLCDAEAYFHEDGQYRRPIVTNRYEAPIDLFDAHLYPGGAVRLRHLHHLLGDATFRAVLRRYLETHRDSVAETVDLARAVEAETGENHDWWFDQWIHNGGYPNLEISFQWDDKEKLAALRIKQTSPMGNGGAGNKNGKSGGGGAENRFFRLPAQVAFEVGGKLQHFPVTLEGKEGRYHFRLDKRPTMVLFDPAFGCPVKKVSFSKGEDLLIAQLRKGPGVVARIEAAEALGEKNTRKVLDALGKALLAEPFWGVQVRIARALGAIGGEAARDALLRGLRIAHPKARREVVRVLGHFRNDPKVAKALATHAEKGDESYFVEAELARSLGHCNAPQAEKLLPRLLERPTHLDQMPAAVYDAYAQLHLEESWPLLREGMRYGAAPLARGAAMMAAVAVARRHPHLRGEVTEALSDAAEHRGNPAASFRGKLAAVRALTALEHPAVLPILRRVGERAVDGRIAKAAQLAADSLRERLARPAELDTLRADVDKSSNAHKDLHARLEKLEQLQEAPASPRAKKAGKSRKG